MFHQKQTSSYCRCDAINNLFGDNLVSLKEFDLYCDEYDIKINFDKGSSRRRHMFYTNRETDNIFGYILMKKRINVKMKHYDYYSNKKIKSRSSDTIGYIVYNRGHTYCVRIVGNEFWLIDSMKGKPNKIANLSCIERKGIGVIEITK